jgi:hypothetical protein
MMGRNLGALAGHRVSATVRQSWARFVNEGGILGSTVLHMSGIFKRVFTSIAAVVRLYIGWKPLDLH